MGLTNEQDPTEAVLGSLGVEIFEKSTPFHFIPPPDVGPYTMIRWGFQTFI
jgi:hypothetical protein